ncbi:MAG: hypothetical protein SCARUB_00057 [Candidatus Scalindua rubra]|uniref:Uncharacterized protein n=1 Tax=Candidatus Scalindua rubra TaxID=1872076 RepID=A0A1E3XGN4_9BACT|nr:MAG: hypothetical protein SCARUB_00057 [Candidatus Scalindua rubra]
MNPLAGFKDFILMNNLYLIIIAFIVSGIVIERIYRRIVRTREEVKQRYVNVDDTIESKVEMKEKSVVTLEKIETGIKDLKKEITTKIEKLTSEIEGKKEEVVNKVENIIDTKVQDKLNKIDDRINKALQTKKNSTASIKKKKILKPQKKKKL